MGMAAIEQDSMADTYALKVAEGLAANKPLTGLHLPRESLALIVDKAKCRMRS